MPGDDKIYGFNKADTIELINLIGNADGEFAETVPREFCKRRHWIGFLYASYRGATIGFWVVPSIALDGSLPFGVQWVVNLYKWNFGIAGATVRVEEDIANNRWIPLQQEYVCPDGRSISEPPAPPPADPPVYPPE